MSNQINELLGNVLPGKYPLVFLIIAVIGGMFLKRQILYNKHSNQIIWALSIIAVYYLIMVITKLLGL